MSKVWIIGLSRTGTMALTETLNNYCRMNIVHYPSPQVLRKTWFSQDGASDIVVSSMYPHLDKKYPKSKFILTMREKESWLESTERFITTKDAMKFESGNPVTTEARAIRKQIYGSESFDREIWSEGYDRYVSEVREYFKDRDDLLEVDFITGESTPKEVYKFLNIVNYVPPSKFITTNVGLEQAKVWQRKRNESSRNKTKG
jgi:hypothetical protein